MERGANQPSFIAGLALAVSLFGFNAVAHTGQAGDIRVNQVGYEAGRIARARRSARHCQTKFARPSFSHFVRSQAS